MGLKTHILSVNIFLTNNNLVVTSGSQTGVLPLTGQAMLMLTTPKSIYEV